MIIRTRTPLETMAWRTLLLICTISLVVALGFQSASAQSFVFQNAAWDPVALKVKDQLPMHSKAPVMFYQRDRVTGAMGPFNVWLIDKTDSAAPGEGVVPFYDGCYMYLPCTDPPDLGCLSSEGGMCSNTYTYCPGSPPAHSPGYCSYDCPIPANCSDPVTGCANATCMCVDVPYECPPDYPDPPPPGPYASGGGGCPNGCSAPMACIWDGDMDGGCAGDCSDCPDGLCDGVGIGCQE